MVEWETARLRHGRDVTADMVPLSPLRSIPIDMIATAVVRRLLKVQSDFPILSIKVIPKQQDVVEAVAALASRWQTPQGQAVD